MQTVFENQIIAAGLSPDDKLLVAVSGGVDSVVLLHLLSACTARFGLCLSVAHLDHRIRPESAADAGFVQQFCTTLDLPCIVESCDVSGLAHAKAISLEMAGREARREFLLRTSELIGARLIALGHHRDDQVETFLLRLLRGSGVAGLSAMRTCNGRWWRPLLEFSREDIVTYARQHQLAWVEDASNADPAFLRNQVRHQLLPRFREINPQFDERTAELCQQLRADDVYWQEQVSIHLPTMILSAGDGLRLDRQKLLALPAALRARMLREALRRIRDSLQGLESVHLHAIERLLAGERSQAQLDLPSCWVARRYEFLWLRKTAAERMSDYDLSLPVPGELKLPCGRVLQARLASQRGEVSATVAEFLWPQDGTSLRVRNWRPGDCFDPEGLAGSKKLKRLFGDQKVEMEERSRVPLLVSEGQILWVVGMRRSRHALPNIDTGKILVLKLLEGG